MSGGFCGGGLFSNSSKCSTHLFLYCSSPTICLLDLSSTGLSGFPNLPASFLVVSYRPLIFPALAACSAALASPSMYFLLFALMLLLVFLWAFEYSFNSLDLSALALLELTAAFFFFLALILLSVSAEIQSLWWYFLGPSTSLQAVTKDSFTTFNSLIFFHQILEYVISVSSAETIPYLRPNWPKSISYLWPKRIKTCLLWASHTCIAYTREHPLSEQISVTSFSPTFVSTHARHVKKHPWFIFYYYSFTHCHLQKWYFLILNFKHVTLNGQKQCKSLMENGVLKDIFRKC